MSSSSKTQTGLSQFSENDKPEWLRDYNTDMQLIDQIISMVVPCNCTYNKETNKAILGGGHL